MAKQLKQLKVEDIINLRDAAGFCSGTDLSDWFQKNLGDPSPSGSTHIGKTSAYRFWRFLDSCYDAAVQNNGEDSTPAALAGLARDLFSCRYLI